MALFLRNGKQLHELAAYPYDAEAVLQDLLATHPSLLAGDEIEPHDPLRFLLIRREAPVKGLGVDLLFIDHTAVPTFVEVKKAENPDVRRKVVGQMLDYAANAPAEWDAGALSSWLAERCIFEGTTAEAELANLGHQFPTESAFWNQAVENLRAGDVRLVFVADVIPESLQAIVEFLNERMTPTTVIGIEVRQYRTEAGQELLSASLVGQTEQARVVKGKGRVRPSVIPVLVDAGALQVGDALWLRPEVLPAAVRPPADDPLLKFTLEEVSGSYTMLGHTHRGIPAVVQASLGRDHVLQLLNPEHTQQRPRAVHDAYAKEPGGQALGVLAEALGVWNAE